MWVGLFGWVVLVVLSFSFSGWWLGLAFQPVEVVRERERERFIIFYVVAILFYCVDLYYFIVLYRKIKTGM